MFHGEWVMDDEMDDAVNSLVYRTEQTKKNEKRTKNKPMSTQDTSGPVPWSSKAVREVPEVSLLRWEVFVENVGFEPGVKQWRSIAR